MSTAGGYLPPEGLVVELVTPLTPDGSLDETSFYRLLERVRPAADGLVLAGPAAGEGLAQSVPGKLALLRAALQFGLAPLPLFLSITGPTSEDTRQCARGVWEVLVRFPYDGPVFLADLPLWHHSNRGLPQFYRALLQEVPLPLVLLNLPAVVGRRAPLWKHRNLRTQVVKKLAGLPAVVGLIYDGSLRRFLNYHLASLARPLFAFYEADEVRFLTRPGAWGVVSAGAQLLPEVWRRVSRACLHPEEIGESVSRRQQLWEDSARLVHLARLYRAAPAALLKSALKDQGVLASDAVLPDTHQVSLSQKQGLLDFSRLAGGL